VVAVLVGQVVPIWLGTQLIRRSHIDEVLDTGDHDHDVFDADASEGPQRLARTHASTLAVGAAGVTFSHTV
jgi:hypothetical protein